MFVHFLMFGFYIQNTSFNFRLCARDTFRTPTKNIHDFSKHQGFKKKTAENHNPTPHPPKKKTKTYNYTTPKGTLASSFDPPLPSSDSTNSPALMRCHGLAWSGWQPVVFLLFSMCLVFPCFFLFFLMFSLQET